MAEISLLEGVRRGLSNALENDERAVVLGEEVTSGGVFGATRGLAESFGPTRVIDTPVGDGGLLGAAVGMALHGSRPIVEVQFADFVWSGFDQLISEMATYRYRSAGQYSCPAIIRMPYGAGVRGGIFHSQSPEAHLAHVPGLVVAVPSSPADALGLMRAALDGDDPVVFLEPKAVYSSAMGPLPEDAGAIPFGRATRLREGDDVTVVAYGAMRHRAAEAADAASDAGIGVDLLDLRSLRPLDTDAIVESVQRTGRAVIVHEAPGFCGFGAELAALLADRAILYLEAPVTRVTGHEAPVPYALEELCIPDAERVLGAIETVVNF